MLIKSGTRKTGKTAEGADPCSSLNDPRGLLAFAIVLEIIANVFLKFSDGFRRKAYGLLSIAAVLGAFSALSQAVKGIDLSVAYALWVAGIAATLAAGWIMFGQRLNNKG